MTMRLNDETNASDLDARAIGVLKGNDLGGYTVPTKRLYPYQWNWDSAFVALGISVFDLERAWIELETLFEGQWADGMLPHIVFHRNEPSYFPGPDIWRTNTIPATSGYTQPPVAATIVRRLYEAAPPDKGMSRLREFFPKLLAWHRWLHTKRDIEALGLVAIVHPWESGRDNLPDWDEPLARVDTSNVEPYARHDTNYIDPSMRPTNAEYDRYLALVKFGRKAGWDPDAMARESPFWVADPGMNLILLRADRDLLALAEKLGEESARTEIQGWIARSMAGVDRLWNADVGAYCSLDLRTGRLGDGVTSASMLAFYAGLDHATRTQRLIDHLERMWRAAPYGVPSFDPAHAKFDRLRYWRGPVWAVMNYMIGLGLSECGLTDLAERVRADTRRLIEASGFREHFCPLTGAGAGGGTFSWTAAIWLAWASPSRARLAA